MPSQREAQYHAAHSAEKLNLRQAQRMKLYKGFSKVKFDANELFVFIFMFLF